MERNLPIHGNQDSGRKQKPNLFTSSMAKEFPWQGNAELNLTLKTLTRDIDMRNDRITFEP